MCGSDVVEIIFHVLFREIVGARGVVQVAVHGLLSLTKLPIYKCEESKSFFILVMPNNMV